MTRTAIGQMHRRQPPDVRRQLIEPAPAPSLADSSWLATRAACSNSDLQATTNATSHSSTEAWPGVALQAVGPITQYVGVFQTSERTLIPFTVKNYRGSSIRSGAILYRRSSNNGGVSTTQPGSRWTMPIGVADGTIKVHELTWRSFFLSPRHKHGIASSSRCHSGPSASWASVRTSATGAGVSVMS